MLDTNFPRANFDTCVSPRKVVCKIRVEDTTHFDPICVLSNSTRHKMIERG